MPKNTGFDEHGSLHAYTFNSSKKVLVDFTLQVDSSVSTCGQVRPVLLDLCDSRRLLISVLTVFFLLNASCSRTQRAQQHSCLIKAYY